MTCCSPPGHASQATTIKGQESRSDLYCFLSDGVSRHHAPSDLELFTDSVLFTGRNVACIAVLPVLSMSSDHHHHQPPAHFDYHHEKSIWNETLLDSQGRSEYQEHLITTAIRTTSRQTVPRLR